MQERFTLTRSGYDYLKRELDSLTAQKSVDDAYFDDVNYSNDPQPEEAAHDDAKELKDVADERVETLRRVLLNADVIDEDPDPTRVNVGDKVTVWDFAEKETMQFEIVSGAEVVHGRDGVAADSPVGMALQGHSVGDVIEVEVPDGKMRYAIRAIESMKTNSN